MKLTVNASRYSGVLLWIKVQLRAHLFKANRLNDKLLCNKIDVSERITFSYEKALKWQTKSISRVYSTIENLPLLPVSGYQDHEFLQ